MSTLSVTIQQKDKNVLNQVIELAHFNIGRLPDCNICLKDTTVSRQHLKVERAEDGVFIIDQNSSGGTLVNNKPIPPLIKVRVFETDKVQVGATVLTFAPKVEVKVEEPAVEAPVKAELSLKSISISINKPVKAEPVLAPSEDSEKILTAARNQAEIIVDIARQTAAEIQAKTAKEARGKIEKEVAHAHEAAERKAKEVLHASEVQAREILESAERKAASITDSAEANADELARKKLADAHKEIFKKAESAVSDAQKDAKKIKDEARLNAEVLRDKQVEHNDQLLEEALKQAHQLQEKMTAECDELLAQARTEAKELKETAQAYAQKLKQQTLEDSQRALSEAMTKAKAKAHEIEAQAFKDVEAGRQKIMAELESLQHKVESEVKELQLENQKACEALKQKTFDEIELMKKTSLAEERDRLEHELKELYTEVASAKEILLREQKKLQDYVTNGQSELKELDQEISEKQSSLQSLVQHLEKNQDELKQTQVAFSELLKKKTNLQTETQSLEQKAANLHQSMSTLESQKKIKDTEFQAHVQQLKDKLDDSIRDFKKQSEEKMLAITDEQTMRAASFQADFISSLEKQRQTLAQLVHQRVWKTLLNELPQDSFKKLDASTLKEINKAVQDHLVAQSTQPTIDFKTQNKALRRQKMRNYAWLTSGLSAGIAASFLTWYVHNHTGSANLAKILEQQRQEREVELASRKFQPAQDNKIRSNYVDSVVYTQDFTNHFLDDHNQEKWTKEATRYFYRVWKLDEEKTIEVISMSRTLVQALREQRENIHPDFVKQNIQKMQEAESQVIAKMKAKLGTDVKFADFKRMESKFFSDISERTPAANP